MRPWFAGLVLSLSTSVAWAASPQVGEEAPDFDSANWVLNAPRQASVRDLRGEVVFVEKWGVKCPPCLALVPHVQKLQEEYGAKGLHIFAFEAQNHSPDEIRATIQARGGKTYPVSAGGANNYQTDGGIPHGWLIGVEGKVIWQGNPGDPNFDRTLQAEMAKVRFPGLGRNDFDRALAKSLQSFLRQDLSAARREASKVQENARSSEAAKADADYLLARYTTLIERRQEEARALEGEGRWADAWESWSWVADACKKDPEGAEAKSRLDELKKDEAVQKELDASRRLTALLRQLEGRPAAERQAALSRFAREDKFQGTRAASEAEALAR